MRTTSSWRCRATAACVARLFHRVAPASSARIDEILETVGLDRRSASGSPAHLSHGQKQWLEIGMLLAQDPKLLLVDEPVAGMTDAETDADRRAAASDIAKDQLGGRGRARHGLRPRTRRASVTVLHEGSVLAEGSLDHGERRSARDRSLSGAVSAMINPSTSNSISTTARRRRCAASRSRPSRARSPACSAATAWARPACCAPSSGMQPVSGGAIAFDGKAIARPAALRRARASGIGYVPQGREIFPLLTVRGEPRDRLRRAAARRAPCRCRRDLRAVPGAEGHAGAARRRPLGRPAAAARHRAARW